MTHQDLAGAKPVAAWASRRWVGDPLPGGGLYELAEHNHQRNSAQPLPRTVPCGTRQLVRWSPQRI
jgi:hypothetical protein